MESMQSYSKVNEERSMGTHKHIPNFKKITKNRVYLQLTFITIDEFSEDASVSIVGYCFFPLFKTISSDKECDKSSEKDFYLMKGHYQIPIYKDGFQQVDQAIVMEKIERSFERIPACTALIRIYETNIVKSNSQRNLIRGRGIEKTKK